MPHPTGRAAGAYNSTFSSGESEAAGGGLNGATESIFAWS
jgi:hypothetical protein